MLGRAGSVFCLGCDSDGGVTWAGIAFFAASGDGWRWAGNSLFVGSGDLVSFATEETEAACFRCWFSGQVSVWLDGAALVWVGIVSLLAVRLPLLGVCSQETSTPWTWSMVAMAGWAGWGGMGWCASSGVRVQRGAAAIALGRAQLMLAGGGQKGNAAGRWRATDEVSGL